MAVASTRDAVVTDQGEAAQLDNKKNDGSQGSQGRWLAARKLAGYLKEHFPSTLFVTACVAVLHLGTSCFDAFDSYTFLWMGNFASESKPISDGEPRIAVVEIDEPTFDVEFGGRSPLDRSKLLERLREVYAANPSLVVIDLDLAPTDKSVPGSAEKITDDAIQELILTSATRGTSSVLLEPFKTDNLKLKKAHAIWRHKLECGSEPEIGSGRVIFGHGDIPERFGMSNMFFFDEHSFFTAARRASGSEENTDSTSVRVARKKLLIDPRAYKGKLTVITTSEGKTGAGLTSLICDVTRGGCQDSGSVPTTPVQKPDAGRVVYFGAAYGGDDLFTTPLGKLYGVELHAAAFATCWQSENCSKLHQGMHHFAAIVFDLLIALALGWFIASFWKLYMRWSMDPDPEVSDVAGVAAFMLMFFLVVITLFLTVGAGWLLANTGIWISPIPIAFGMFFEAWVLGPIAKHGKTGAHPAPVASEKRNVLWPRPWIGRKSLTVMKRVAMGLVLIIAAYLMLQ